MFLKSKTQTRTYFKTRKGIKNQL